MKKIIVIILVILMAAAMVVGCSSTKTASKLSGKEITFEYNAYTRGSSVNYFVTKDTIRQKEVLQGEATTYRKPVDDNDWADLMAATDKVNLETIPTMEAPSKQHQVDGAMAATLTIIVDGKTYKSPTFDHGNPPAGIKDIIDNITVI